MESIRRPAIPAHAGHRLRAMTEVFGHILRDLFLPPSVQPRKNPIMTEILVLCFSGGCHGKA
jgi:hypothetical protein